MTEEENLLIVRYVKAACPQQAIDKYTPEAWHDLLGDLDYADAQAAAKAVASRQPFVAPCEIRAEVARIQAGRYARAKIPDPPPGLDDDTERAVILAARVAAAAGRDPAQAMARAVEEHRRRELNGGTR